MEIKTKEEWWAALKKNWRPIGELLVRFCPLEERGIITVLNHRDRKDPALATYLKSAWFRAPDTKATRDLPGWLVLCDLCSEADVLTELPPKALPLSAATPPRHDWDERV